MNNMSLKVIITAPVHPFLMNTLKEKGYELLYEPAISYIDLSAIIEDIHGLIVTTRLSIDAVILAKAKSLKWIARLGSGMELIDTTFAAEHGIICVSSPEGNRTTVGEHALGILLSLMNRIHSSYEEIKIGKWIRDANRADELTGKVVGIIGLGNTGAAFAKVLKGFDVTILAHDLNESVFKGSSVQSVSLQSLQAQADVISIHLPLTDLTHHYINDAFFEACQKKPYFISTCRGQVTSTDSVLKALQNQLVRGVGLDVLENEQLTQYTPEEKALLDRLFQFPNFLATPHIAGYSHEAYYKMAQVVLEKLAII